MPSTLQNASAVAPPAGLYDFQPSAGRARFLDRRMRLRLKDSLSHVFEQCEVPLALSRERIDRFLWQLDRHPVSPLAFSYYCDLVIAIEGDELSDAVRLIDELLALPAPAGGAEILELADPRRDAIAQRYSRFVDTDPEMPFEILAPSRAAADACRAQIQSAFALMDQGDPELAAEIRALLREIVLAAGATQANAMTFDGASAFMLWGAIIINANRGNGELGMVQMLAHESAHNLLFGLGLDEPLLHNSPDERYPSPLRLDLRPLEGIYHATYVSARMHRSIRMLLDAGALAGELESVARKELADNARYFSQGLKVIEEHGRLTEIGADILRGARDYMSAAVP